jgi:hypothetical protein
VSIQIYNGEILAWSVQEAERIKSGKSAPYHAVLCDPPYGIAFMGKEWDDAGGPEAFQVSAKFWGQALKPLLHPGALVFLFAGTRMWHRLAAGMEDAGFHLWDTLMWLHGQGFPKAQDISKLIDKSIGAEQLIIGTKQKGSSPLPGNHDGNWADGQKDGEYSVSVSVSELGKPWAGHKTPQLKPAWEPVLCFRAPVDGKRYADLALEYGSGCLNVDAGRIGTDVITAHGGGHNNEGRKYGGGLGIPTIAAGSYEHVGRYPANLAFDEVTGLMLDEQTGELKAGVAVRHNSGGKTCHTNKTKPLMKDMGFGDIGGASRFFYVAKASPSERNAGLLDKNIHPTVKPINLNKWLAGLLLPPSSVGSRRLLVPFSGVGSEMIGASIAGWGDITGVEMNPEYMSIAKARLKHWTNQTALDVPATEVCQTV